MSRNICVFCSSSNKIDKTFFDDAEVFARAVAKNGDAIVCGGGVRGLMGKITCASRQCNGKVIGVIPEFMRRIGWDSKDLSELVVVETMSERKMKMIEMADAVVALAGGTGTLDELMEVITLKSLGKFAKPIVILNTNGFYNHIEAFFKQLIDEKFTAENSLRIWKFVDKPEQIIPAINNFAAWDNENAMKLAVV